MKVVHEGKEITLVQEPYIDGVAGERPYYRAVGTDAEGNEYKVIWDVVDGWEDIEDESDMCDWDSPASVELI